MLPAYPLWIGSPPMCVLLVEDEPTIREVMAETLQDAGFDVYEAPDGDSALALLSDTPRKFTILVTDFHMPGQADGGHVAAPTRTYRSSSPPAAPKCCRPAGGRSSASTCSGSPTCQATWSGWSARCSSTSARANPRHHSLSPRTWSPAIRRRSQKQGLLFLKKEGLAYYAFSIIRTSVSNRSAS